VYPGHKAFTWIRTGAQSSAADFVRPMTACLEVAYEAGTTVSRVLLPSSLFRPSPLLRTQNNQEMQLTYPRPTPQSIHTRQIHDPSPIPVCTGFLAYHLFRGKFRA
jgi:hypothetical protein